MLEACGARRPPGTPARSLRKGHAVGVSRAEFLDCPAIDVPTYRITMRRRRLARGGVHLGHDGESPRVIRRASSVARPLRRMTDCPPFDVPTSRITVRRRRLARGGVLLGRDADFPHRGRASSVARRRLRTSSSVPSRTVVAPFPRPVLIRSLPRIAGRGRALVRAGGPRTASGA